MLLENVVFLYVKIQQPDFKYQSTTEKEFSVQCLITKAQAKEWNKKYKKQPAKVVENDEFEAQFSIPVPEAFEAQDEQYVIQLKRSTTYKDGNPIPDTVRPRVFLKQSTGKLVDITKDRLVGNGSVGAASYVEMTNDYGTFAGLKAIRVDDLIEYENNNDFSELGDIESLADDFSNIPERAPRKEKEEEKPVAHKAPAKEKETKVVVKEKEEVKETPKTPGKRGPKPKGSVVKEADPVKAADDSDDDGSPF